MKTTGSEGWIGLGLFILAWDWLADETLTASFHRALQDPKKRWIPIVGFAMVSAHLWRPVNHIPPRYDPIHYFGRKNVMPKVRY